MNSSLRERRQVAAGHPLACPQHGCPYATRELMPAAEPELSAHLAQIHARPERRIPMLVGWAIHRAAARAQLQRDLAKGEPA